MKRNRGWWKLIVWAIVLIGVWWVLLSWDITPPASLEVKAWQSFANMHQYFWLIDSIKLRIYLKMRTGSLGILSQWIYQFSGNMSPAEFIKKLEAWPQQEYTRVTLLEWRSMYDIDAYLTQKNLIKEGAFIDHVSSSASIDQRKQQFSFIGEFSPQTLEWFIYPDTYFIDVSKNIINQIMTLWLKNFEEKIWNPYKQQFKNFNQRLRADWFRFSLSLYEILTLATVIDKEERIIKNKPLIAGLFLNRLQNNMRIDADITLCYGLKQGYEYCTPAIIVQHLYDKNNPYNTRVISWLPPTPISNPRWESVASLLNYEKNNFFFYLHDPSWQIHFWISVEDHNSNKSKYLK